MMEEDKTVQCYLKGRETIIPIEPPELINFVSSFIPWLSNYLSWLNNKKIQRVIDELKFELFHLKNLLENPNFSEIEKEYITNLTMSILQSYYEEPIKQKRKLFKQIFQNINTNVPQNELEYEEKKQFIEILKILHLRDVYLLKELYNRFDELIDKRPEELLHVYQLGQIVKITDYAESFSMMQILQNYGLIEVYDLPRSGCVTPQSRLSKKGKRFYEFILTDEEIAIVEGR